MFLNLKWITYVSMKKIYTGLWIGIIAFAINGCATIQDHRKAKLNPDPLTPVLFVPGLSTSASLPCLDMAKDEWPELYEMFEEHGYDLKIACIPPNARITKIAKILYYEIKLLFDKDENKDKKFHIIAKSMGGIVTRAMLHNDDLMRTEPHHISDRVLSVTTISSPHHGSKVADMLMGENGDDNKCLDSLGSLILSSIDKRHDENKGLIESREDLRTSKMDEFNKEHPFDDSKIPFFSFGYKIECDDILCKIGKRLLPFYPVNALSECYHNQIVEHGKNSSEKTNDGFVSEASAKWGIYLGTFEGEHFAETSNLPLYKYRSIWKDVFERVIVNLNKQKMASK